MRWILSKPEPEEHRATQQLHCWACVQRKQVTVWKDGTSAAPRPRSQPPTRGGNLCNRGQMLRQRKGETDECLYAKCNAFSLEKKEAAPSFTTTRVNPEGVTPRGIGRHRRTHAVRSHFSVGSHIRAAGLMVKRTEWRHQRRTEKPRRVGQGESFSRR